jgi:hypothetical protein
MGHPRVFGNTVRRPERRPNHRAKGSPALCVRVQPGLLSHTWRTDSVRSPASEPLPPAAGPPPIPAQHASAPPAPLAAPPVAPAARGVGSIPPGPQGLAATNPTPHSSPARPPISYRPPAPSLPTPASLPHTEAPGSTAPLPRSEAAAAPPTATSSSEQEAAGVAPPPVARGHAQRPARLSAHAAAPRGGSDETSPPPAPVGHDGRRGRGARSERRTAARH